MHPSYWSCLFVAVQCSARHVDATPEHHASLHCRCAQVGLSEAGGLTPGLSSGTAAAVDLLGRERGGAPQSGGPVRPAAEIAQEHGNFVLLSTPLQGGGVGAVRSKRLDDAGGDGHQRPGEIRGEW